MTIQRILYIIRGLPGAGKTELGRTLATSVFSADDFFVGSDGQFRYDHTRIGDAQKWCQELLTKWYSTGRGSAAVANTFSRRWEMQSYLLWRPVDVRLVVIDLFDQGLSDKVLAARNTHGVPETKIAEMRARWEFDWGNAPLLKPSRSK